MKEPNIVDIDRAIKFLNELVAIDPYAIADLLRLDVPCNQLMADHPTVQVRSHSETTTYIAPDTWRLGILGLLNGLFGVDDNSYGHIAVVYESGKLIGFRKSDTLVGFIKRDN